MKKTKYLPVDREDLTTAESLKGQGYATGHLGDKDEFLPAMHGFELKKMQEATP